MRLIHLLAIALLAPCALRADVTATGTIIDNDTAGTDLIDPARVIAWAPGVPGGIPSRTTICYTDTGALDSVATLNTQIAACAVGQVVQLLPGTYTLSAKLTIAKGVTVRGISKAGTIFNCTVSDNCVQMGNFPSAPSAVGVSGSPAKGATSLTLASVAGLAVNDYVVIDQVNDGTEVVNTGTTDGSEPCRSGSSGMRCLGQMTKITAINSLTISIDPPLHHGYAAAQLPQVWEVTGVTTGAGLESVTINRTNFPDSGGSNIRIVACSGCYVKDVASNSTEWWHVYIDRSIFSTVSSNDLFSGQSHAGGYAYGVVAYGFSTANLIENNYCNECRHSFVLEAGPSGNVFAYNYSVNEWQGAGTGETWLATGLTTHGAHPSMNLFEGNTAGKIFADYAHGSASYNTAYRNNVIRASAYTGSGGITSARRAVAVAINNTGFNFVGNVLGVNGQSFTAYDPGQNRTSAGTYVYNFGYFDDGDTTAQTYAATLASTYLHGNFDWQSSTQIWSGNSNHTLPNSLYTGSTPGFYNTSGSCSWPPVNPANGSVSTLPAAHRYGGGSGACDVGAGCKVGQPVTTLGSAAAATVQTGVTAAANGDCVRLPASASATWTTSVSIPSSKFITLDLNGSTITLSGASGQFSMGCHASGMNRITNGSVIKALGGFASFSGPFQINDTRNCHGVRVDHIAFSQTGSWNQNQDVWIDGQGQGPCSIDNNTFTGMRETQEFIHMLGWGHGNTTGWTTDSNNTLAGGAMLCYFENNIFTALTNADGNSPVIQGYYGTRVGYRYNTFHSTRIDMHGTPGEIGQRWWEIYGNVVDNPAGKSSLCTYNIRAGTGIIHDENLGWGTICMGEEDSGYPADYQVGRGQNNTLDPAYYWNATPTPSLNDCDCQGAQANMIQLNRDVFAAVRPGYTPFTYPHPLRFE